VTTAASHGVKKALGTGGETESGRGGERVRESFICHISEATNNEIHIPIQTMAGCQEGKKTIVAGHL